MVYQCIPYLRLRGSIEVWIHGHGAPAAQRAPRGLRFLDPALAIIFGNEIHDENAGNPGSTDWLDTLYSTQSFAISGRALTRYKLDVPWQVSKIHHESIIGSSL